MDDRFETIRLLLESREDCEKVTEKTYNEGTVDTLFTAALTGPVLGTSAITVAFWRNNTIKIVYLESPDGYPFVATCDEVYEAVNVIDSIAVFNQ